MPKNLIINDETKERIIEMRKRNILPKQIASNLGLPLSRVHIILRESKLFLHPHKGWLDKKVAPPPPEKYFDVNYYYQFETYTI